MCSYNDVEINREIPDGEMKSDRFCKGKKVGNLCKIEFIYENKMQTSTGTCNVQNEIVNHYDGVSYVYDRSTIQCQAEPLPKRTYTSIETIKKIELMNQYQALALTLACELPILLVLLRAYSVLRILIVSAVASLITHPFAWYFAMLLSPSEYQIGVVVIEGIVIMIEGLIYSKFVPLSFKKALLYSAIANIGSFLIGGMILS